MKICVAAFIILLTASACGFEPIHAAPKAGDTRSELLQLIRNIALNGPNTHEGNLLVAELEDLLNPNHEQVGKDFLLKMDINTSEQDLVILGDATASRKRVNVISEYTLTRISDNQLLDSGSVTYNNSYAVQDDANFAAYTVRQDIRKRALTELAERYKLRMVGVFAELSLPAELRQDKQEQERDRFDALRARDANLPSRGALPRLTR